MSFRPKPQTASTAAPSSDYTGTAQRLSHVLAAGHARRTAPTAMMNDDLGLGPLHPVRGDTYPLAPMQYADVPSDSEKRKVLFIKGLVFGIPKAKLGEAYQKAMEIIAREKITTIAWDGDKLGYTGPKGEEAPMTFTFVIKALADKVPGLEFIYFKKAGKARGLISGEGTVDLDEGAAKHGTTQYLGPMPFLNSRNTIVVDSKDPIPVKRPGMNLGIEFSGDMKWYELGLKGLELAKSEFGNDSVSYLVVGLGGAVKKELEKVAESYAGGEAKYPLGLAMSQVAMVEVVR